MFARLRRRRSQRCAVALEAAPAQPPRRLLRARGERGAVAVEFAILLPMFLLLVFGIIDFGYMINRDTMINNVSRDAARMGSLDGTYTQINSTITQELTAYGISATSPTTVINICDVVASDPTGNTKYCGSNATSGYQAHVTSGDTVQVTITYNYAWITPVMSSLFGKSVTLSKSTEMIVE